MGLLYGLCLTAMAVLAILARREPSLSRKPYYRSAVFLFRLVSQKSLVSKQKPDLQNNNVAKNLQALNPGKNIKKDLKRYYVEKIWLVLNLVFWGNLMSLVVFLYQSQDNAVDITGIVKKNTWNQGNIVLELQAESDNKEEISVVVEPKSLTEKEAALLAKEVFQKLIPEILDENAGTDRIDSNLNLVSQMEEYPFQISWETSHPHIVKATGEIVNEASEEGDKKYADFVEKNDKKEVISEEGTSVFLTAWLLYDDSYQQFRYKKEFEIKVYPQEKTPQEKWRDEISSAIESRKVEDAYEETLRLPQTIQGVAIRWREKSRKDSITLWIIIVIAALLLSTAKDNDLKQRVVKRNRQLEKDYPELVNKLALYLGAGMTVKNTWKKLVQDYENKRKIHKDSVYRVLYEEMLISWHELENGVSEGEVYYQFGKRMGGNRYRKLSGLLYNHLQKGNNNLLHALREETENAWEERKNKARIIGEEVSTKLLFPMMIMLILVMTIIMVPVYLSF